MELMLPVRVEVLLRFDIVVDSSVLKVEVSLRFGSRSRRLCTRSFHW